MTRSLVWLGRGTAAGLVCGGLLGVTPEAHAGHCSYCTESRPHDVVLPLTEIGSDGVVVIVLADYSDRLIDEAWWQHVVVFVTDDAGVTVDGELELHSGFTPATWRPSQPWVPGSFEVTVGVDLEAGGQRCPPIEVVAPLLVLDTPTTPHPAFTVTTSETYSLVPRFELSTLVCCDGALPYRPSVQGVICPSHPTPRPEIGTGFCTELLGRGRLLVETVVEPVVAAGSPLLAVREVTAGDRPTTSGPRTTVVLESPACIELEILDLLTGVRTNFPSCHGDELGNQLGEVALDAGSSLVESCVGEPYVCEVIASDRWDPNACTRWPDGATIDPIPDASSETDADADADTGRSGGGCSLPGGPFQSCAWLLIAGIMRRRRASPTVSKAISIFRASCGAIRIGRRHVMAPVVIGPAAIPMLDLETIAAAPVLAMLSTLAHMDDPGCPRQALLTLETLARWEDDADGRLADILQAALTVAVREQMEELMRTEKYEYQSEFAKKYFARGREEGRAEGREEGREEGRVEGQARALLLVLHSRALDTSDAVVTRIKSERDGSRLEAWTRRASTATSIEDVFADE